MTVAALLAISALTWLPIGELLPTTTQSQLRGVQQVAPQGWAFFTKSPRGQVHFPYRSDGSDGWITADRGPNAQLRWAFGLNRESRLTEFDVQTVLAQVEDDWWQECSKSASDSQCLDNTPAHEVSAVGHDLRLCGDVGLVRREPVPWAYRDYLNRTDGESIRLLVSCQEPG
ncbi:SdpA family antimicrobial peptide system protein [Microbacterium sp.]|uniref:SdpA family antimicrobial peptide system protein n=1 Tax=Microbacterium sp. TaxID=51671 RepID=UPI00281180BB|nr:SdpA family antimicrobial peptide system protein [Microbacterium sp.]